MAMWKEIDGYEKLYLISDEGEVYALPKTVITGNKTTHRNGKLLKQGVRGRGNTLYKFVVLSDGNTVKRFSVHRLVAKAFLENPNGYPEVNHKDEDSLNNHVENLEWCDRQYNIEYSKNKAVSQFSIDGEKIAEYKSIKYASAITGIGRKSIENALNGWSNTAGGYIWKYSNQ